MSSRLPTRALSRSVSSSMVSRNSCSVVGGPVDVVLQQARDRRLDRRERRAQVVRHGPEERGAQLRRPRPARLGLGRLGSAAAAARAPAPSCAAKAWSTSWSSAVSVGPARPSSGVLADVEADRRVVRVGGARRSPADRARRASPTPSRSGTQRPTASRSNVLRSWSTIAASGSSSPTSPPAMRASASASAPARRASAAPSLGRRHEQADHHARRRRGRRPARAGSRPRRCVNVWSGWREEPVHDAIRGHGGHQRRRQPTDRRRRHDEQQVEQQVGRAGRSVSRSAVEQRRSAAGGRPATSHPGRRRRAPTWAAIGAAAAASGERRGRCPRPVLVADDVHVDVARPRGRPC